MAYVASSPREHAELLLSHCLNLWGRLPEIEREIDGWDLIDQLRFTEEWPLEEQHLDRLERYAMEGVLTPKQCARYERLKHLVAERRPIVRRIRGD
jgi:hypothetical protein